MNRLRQIHLYLGCMFAPMLALFALSGIWQNYFWGYPGFRPTSTHPRVQHALGLVSTLHTGLQLKSGHPSTLSSPALKIFTSVMAVSLLVTMILGVAMAFRFGRARVATVCLAAGVLLPAGLIALALSRQ